MDVNPQLGICLIGSLSSRRAWIEIKKYNEDWYNNQVALLTESVDWNVDNFEATYDLEVALLTESVDWNLNTQKKLKLLQVALLTESVDWNVDI